MIRYRLKPWPGLFGHHRGTASLPLQQQGVVLTFRLSAASSRTRSPSGRTTSNRPRNCGMDKHRLRGSADGSFGPVLICCERTRIFYLDSEGDLSVLFAVAHFKSRAALNGPCAQWDGSDCDSMSRERAARTIQACLVFLKICSEQRKEAAGLSLLYYRTQV